MDRDRFAACYLPAVRAFFASRWQRSPLLADLEDAVQEVFVECFRVDGVLERADPARPGGFRALFFGVLRNIAARHESRAGRSRSKFSEQQPESLPSHEPSPSTRCDRAWAQHLLAEVVRRQRSQASDAAAVRRCELLQLRFHEGLPIRAIALRWGVDVDFLHHQYATARHEFERLLRTVIAERARPGEGPTLLRSLLAVLG